MKYLHSNSTHVFTNPRTYIKTGRRNVRILFEGKNVITATNQVQVQCDSDQRDLSFPACEHRLAMKSRLKL